MARPTTVHVCSECGHQTPRWAGKCPGCGAWNSLVEERVAPTPARGGGGGARGGSGAGGVPAARPVRL
ncbi:MAG TPA: DNA repair protein RadA, partial [Solirubrobacteraceae bacterium]|nr:DNA repair protein RadA [Solirubrobacteraceae bacterium]